MRNIIILLFIIFSITTVIPFSAHGLDPIPEDEFTPDFQKDEDMKIIKSSREPFSFSYGGWIMPIVYDEREGSTELTTIQSTAKLWLNISLWEGSFLHIRGKNVNLRKLKENNRDIDNSNIADLDLGYIGFTFADKSINISLGRKFFILGTGLTFNGRGDGGEIDIYTSYINLQAFGLYTGLLHKDSNPYGLSSKDITDGSKRIFAGGKIEIPFLNQAIYGIGLAQIDKGDEDAEAAGISKQYQSQYYGGGITGILFRSLEYYGEYVYQTGKSYLSGTNDKADIKASAVNSGINLYIDIPFKPVLIAQYAYGSGDTDRESNASPTGNVEGSDTAFTSFGTYVGGNALRPLLSNIHIARGGLVLSPFYFTKMRTLNRMNLIGKYSYYRKDKKDGIYSYSESTSTNAKEIGHGIDASLRWKIFYDLSIFGSYSVFIPGDAYSSDTDNRTFITGGLNLIF